jgi:Ca-activated chloride channel family protein
MKAAGVFLAALLAAGQTFRSGAEGVNVDALVLDGNRPVAGLGVGDFELRDSGVVQRIESVAFEDVPLNVIFALDTSESVAGQPLEHLKQAAIAAISLLRPIDSAALVTFNDYITLRSDWTPDRDRLAGDVVGATAGGATALHDAAYTALTLRTPRPGRTLALIFSDGEDTSSWLPGQVAIDSARRTDAVVYAVELRQPARWSPGYRVDFHSGLQMGVPRVPNSMLLETFLSALATETGGKLLNAARAEQLQDRFTEIITESRTRYLITYSPTGVERGGWHPIEVKLKARKGRVIARRGYLR